MSEWVVEWVFFPTYNGFCLQEELPVNSKNLFLMNIYIYMCVWCWMVTSKALLLPSISVKVTRERPKIDCLTLKLKAFLFIGFFLSCQRGRKRDQKKKKKRPGSVCVCYWNKEVTYIHCQIIKWWMGMFDAFKSKSVYCVREWE